MSVLGPEYWGGSLDNMGQVELLTFENVWAAIGHLENSLVKRHGLYYNRKEEPMGIEERIGNVEDNLSNFIIRAGDVAEKKQDTVIGFYGAGYHSVNVTVTDLLRLIMDKLDVWPVDTPNGVELQPRPKELVEE